jgi:hypothetical protein
MVLRMTKTPRKLCTRALGKKYFCHPQCRQDSEASGDRGSLAGGLGFSRGWSQAGGDNRFVSPLPHECRSCLHRRTQGRGLPSHRLQLRESIIASRFPSPPHGCTGQAWEAREIQAASGKITCACSYRPVRQPYLFNEPRGRHFAKYLSTLTLGYRMVAFDEQTQSLQDRIGRSPGPVSAQFQLTRSSRTMVPHSIRLNRRCPSPFHICAAGLCWPPSR